MSLISCASLFSETIESCSSNRDSLNTHEEISGSSSERTNKEGFSSSMILNLENDKENKIKPSSKLINITQIIPGSKKSKKHLLPIFYRRSLCSKNQKDLFYLEQSISSKDSSNDSLKEYAENKQEIKGEITKQNRVTSTTFASMHTLSNLDVEPNHEFFTEKVAFDYESELKSSMHDGNLIAYCHKCKKETVTVMQDEKYKGFSSFKDMLLCCCSYGSNKNKKFLCPLCSEILLTTN